MLNLCSIKCDTSLELSAKVDLESDDDNNSINNDNNNNKNVIYFVKYIQSEKQSLIFELTFLLK